MIHSVFRWRRLVPGGGVVVSVGFLAACGHLQDERGVRADVDGDPTYVGGERCARCHQQGWSLWRGSHHDEAMAVATDSTVLGDFDDAVFEQDGITEGVAHRAA